MLYFKVQEFVPKDIYDELGDSSLSLMDDRIIISIIAMRDFFKLPIKINDWLFGGAFQNRGFRTAYCGIGSKYSQHKFGRALDFDIKGIPAKEVRGKILANQDKFPLITAMEDNISWVHIDCRWTGRTGIKIFNPS